ncbi:MAG: helix-turn-helix transcriptional regulator [Inquilinaceae bacterium]
MSGVAGFPFPSFGKRLRRLRRAMGVKQLAVAHDLGVDQATVSRWEAARHTPDPELQQKAFESLSRYRTNDAALRRLVENSRDCVHLIDDATHVCLAYSQTRARDWQASQRDLLGVALWPFATAEIRQAEMDLADSDWWSVHTPAPRSFRTSEAVHDMIRISAGVIMWERLYLADGTPARLVSGV